MIYSPANHTQTDEAWCYIGKKDKNFSIDDIGDKSLVSQYVFAVIDRDTKLILAFKLGERELDTVIPIINELKQRIEGYTHITTDSYPSFTTAIMKANGDPKRERYSPIDFVTTKKTIIFGNLATHQISTSHIERQNLTLRMSFRRMTRLTNGFSKKFENLNSALNLNFIYYNFCRIHGSLRMTPAMKAGITSHIGSIKDILAFPN